MVEKCTAWIPPLGLGRTFKSTAHGIMPTQIPQATALRPGLAAVMATCMELLYLKSTLVARSAMIVVRTSAQEISTYYCKICLSTIGKQLCDRWKSPWQKPTLHPAWEEEEEHSSVSCNYFIKRDNEENIAENKHPKKFPHDTQTAER